MRVKKVRGQQVIVLEEGDEVMLTTAQADGVTCVWLKAEGGKITFTGGADIINKIYGVGVREKMRETKPF